MTHKGMLSILVSCAVVCAGCLSVSSKARSNRNGIILNLSADAVLIEPRFSKEGKGISKEEAINACTREEIVEALNSYIDAYVGSQVKALFLNINYQRACFDSKVMESYWNLEDPEKEISGWPRMFWAVKKKGVDPFDVCVKRCRTDKIQPWISVRMNDHHYFDIPSRINRLWMDHPELRTRPPHGLFNYAKKEVRDYYKAFIKEILDTYDVDGIELDWMRTQTLFPDDKTAEGMKLIDQFMREIRELTQEKARARGHAICVAARVPVTPEIGLRFGLDAVRWAQEGLVDILVLSNWFTPTDFDIPVEHWKRAIGPGSSCLIAPGADAAFCLSNNRTIKQMCGNIETMRGFAVSAYSRGADALYIFNNFMIPYKTKLINPDGTLSYTDDRQEALREIGQLSTALGKPRTHVRTYHDPDVEPVPLVPRALPHGETKTFSLHIGPKPEKGSCWVHVGLDSRPGVESADVSVSVNDASCQKVGDMPRDPHYRYDNTKVWHVVKHVSETGARVLQFKVDVSGLQDGYNRITITNNRKEEQALTWLEMRLE